MVQTPTDREIAPLIGISKRRFPNNTHSCYSWRIDATAGIGAASVAGLHSHLANGLQLSPYSRTNRSTEADTFSDSEPPFRSRSDSDDSSPTKNDATTMLLLLPCHGAFKSR